MQVKREARVNFSFSFFVSNPSIYIKAPILNINYLNMNGNPDYANDVVNLTFGRLWENGKLLEEFFQKSIFLWY